MERHGAWSMEHGAWSTLKLILMLMLHYLLLLILIRFQVDQGFRLNVHIDVF